MSAGFTAGPWRFSDGMIQCQSTWSDEGGKHVDWRYPRVLAQVTDDWDCLVNGRLMAAAPSLYEANRQAALALPVLRTMLETSGLHSGAERAREMLVLIEAAIAEADGQ